MESIPESVNLMSRLTTGFSVAGPKSDSSFLGGFRKQTGFDRDLMTTIIYFFKLSYEINYIIYFERFPSYEIFF